jgi:hypothetical protein
LKVRLEAFLNGLPTPVERELMQYQGLLRIGKPTGGVSYEIKFQYHRGASVQNLVR